LSGQRLDHGLVRRRRIEQGGHRERHLQAGILDVRRGVQGAPAPAFRRPLANPPLAFDENRKDPPHPPPVHPQGFLRYHPLVLLRDHLEGDLLQVAGTRLRIDLVFVHAGIAGEIRIDVDAGQQVRRPDVAGGDMRFQDVVELELPGGVGFLGRHGDHPPAADALVARHFRLDQVLVERREGALARQAQSLARGAWSFEVIGVTVVIHAGYPSKTRSPTPRHHSARTSAAEEARAARRAQRSNRSRSSQRKISSRWDGLTAMPRASKTWRMVFDFPMASPRASPSLLAAASRRWIVGSPWAASASTTAWFAAAASSKAAT